MKKIIAVLAVGLVLVVSGCSGKKSDGIKEIQETGVLKTAIVNSENQYTSMNGTEPVGLEPELVEEIASALGVKAEYQVMSQEEALEAVSNGASDIAIGCINTSASLTENYLFTTAYGKGFFYVVTKKGDYAQSVGAFADSSIGMEGNLGDELRIQLSAADNITIHEYGNAETAAKDIEDGRIRAYVCGETQAKKLLADSAFQVQNLFHVNPAQYVIVTGKEENKLVSGMNTLIAQFLTKEE